MGNDLEKQYNLKQKPIRLPGSYSFLKFVDHPTDSSSSLIIIKSPHRAGIINSQILLPIKDIKNIGYSADYSVATCRKCKPLALVRPRSQPEMKLIIRQIIKLGCELGRIFLCDGRLMLWCEQIRSQWLRSPQQIQLNKQTDKSKVFWAGICLINFLHCVYQKDSLKKKKEKKLQIQSFFDPKDKKEYDQFFYNLDYSLRQSSFWSSVSQGMKNLIMVMLARQPNDRIDMSTLMLLPYFATEKQLRLYHMLSDQMLEWDQKQSIIVMETVEMVIHDRIIFDQLVLKDYLSPILVFLLQKKPEMIISAIVELPDPPTRSIVACLKKANAKNSRLFNAVLIKIQKFYDILNQDEYDSAISRTAFCCFELPVLLDKLIRVIPFLLQTIKEPNYKKQIELQLITNVLENKNAQKNILLSALKCVIGMLNANLLSNINKLYNIKYSPQKYEQELQINLHILQVYRHMILAIQPLQLISIMMPKLDPYLSIQEVTDQLFLNAKRCVDLIMGRLIKSRDLSEEDQIQIKYDQTFFAVTPYKKPPQSELVAVLKKQAAKSKNQNIVWLTQILQKQQPLSEI